MSHETNMDYIEMELGSYIRDHIKYNKEDQFGVLILDKREIDIIESTGMLNVRNDDLSVFDVDEYKKNDPTCTECGTDSKLIYKGNEAIDTWLNDYRNGKKYLNDLFNPVDELCEDCIQARLSLGYDPTYMKSVLAEGWELLVLKCYGIVCKTDTTTRKEAIKEANIKKPTIVQYTWLESLNKDVHYYALDCNLNPRGNLVDLRRVHKTMFYFKKGNYSKPFNYEEVR
jgi:hypothetical protein